MGKRPAARDDPSIPYNATVPHPLPSAAVSQPKPSLVARLQALCAQFAAERRVAARPARAALRLERVEAREMPAVVAGTVWLDANANQTQDVGESGAAGVEATLTAPDASTRSTLTGPNGE